jgi:hypothetical protein
LLGEPAQRIVTVARGKRALTAADFSVELIALEIANDGLILSVVDINLV